MKMPFIVNGIVLLIGIISAALFDMSLELQNFHGLVFKMYLLYGSIALFILNAIIAGVYWVKKKEIFARSIFISGLLASCLGAAIAFFS